MKPGTPPSAFAPAVIVAGILLIGIALAGDVPESREVRFRTSDGITVHGDLYMASESRSAPLILLFHQAGADARGEYGPLVGRLLERGYNLLAIDQRVGGTRLGGTKRRGDLGRGARLPGEDPGERIPRALGPGSFTTGNGPYEERVVCGCAPQASSGVGCAP